MTTWRDTAYGGTNGTRSWQRLIADVDGLRNGSFIKLSIRFPGEDEPRSFSVLVDELRALIEAGHGETRSLRVETDADVRVAVREVLG